MLVRWQSSNSNPKGFYLPKYQWTNPANPQHFDPGRSGSHAGLPHPQLMQESKLERRRGLVVMHQLQTGSKSSWPVIRWKYRDQQLMEMTRKGGHGWTWMDMDIDLQYTSWISLHPGQIWPCLIIVGVSTASLNGTLLQYAETHRLLSIPWIWKCWGSYLQNAKTQKSRYETSWGTKVL